MREIDTVNENRLRNCLFLQLKRCEYDLTNLSNDNEKSANTLTTNDDGTWLLARRCTNRAIYGGCYGARFTLVADRNSYSNYSADLVVWWSSLVSIPAATNIRLVAKEHWIDPPEGVVGR
jgi:hypothetical protein